MQTLPKQSPGVRGGATPFWLWRAGCGFILGAAIATLEFAYYVPRVSESTNLGAAAFGALLLAWCGEGILLLLAVGITERAARPHDASAAHRALAVVTGSLVGVVLWESVLQFVGRDAMGIPLFIDLIEVRAAWISVVMYHVWIMLFFGGLAIAVYASERRRAKTVIMLRTAEIDRATFRQRITDTRYAALQAQVDPDFLIQTLARFECLSQTEPAAADRVMDDLIVFLRKALADQRTSVSMTGGPS